jgi:transcriptional regulator with XRE-family HTH domain
MPRRVEEEDIRPPFERVREYRTRRGMTQREAAEVIGVSERTWRRWEQPGSRPPAVALRAIAGIERVARAR